MGCVIGRFTVFNNKCLRRLMAVSGSVRDLVRDLAVLLNHNHIYRALGFRGHFQNMRTDPATIAVLEQSDGIAKRTFKQCVELLERIDLYKFSRHYKTPSKVPVDGSRIERSNAGKTLR